jgi:hypothetical protein
VSKINESMHNKHDLIGKQSSASGLSYGGSSSHIALDGINRIKQNYPGCP